MSNGIPFTLSAMAEAMVATRPNQLLPEFLGLTGLNPWPGQTSSSRGVMFAGHLGQALQIKGCTPRRCQTGLEQEFGKYTFSLRFPTDANIIRVIPKYQQTIGQGGIRENPMNVVVHEDIDTKEVGILNLVRFSTAIDSMHQHFGFRYKYNSEVERQLTRGNTIPKNTIVADSPAIDEHGNYCYGIETPVAMMSIPGVIEDGVVVSRSYLDKISSRGYERRVGSWGKEYFPLNLYGDKDNYKPFPDIGDRIREDGLLFALRRYDDLLAPVEMRPDRLEEPDYIFDKLVYGIPGAKVVDITVHHDEVQNKTQPTPVGMEVQPNKYLRGTHQFYANLIDTYKDLKRTRGDELRITPEFQRLLVEAYADQADPKKFRATKMYRRNPLDDYRVEIAFEYDVVPTVGFKLTGCHGDKGVICAIWEDEDMPVDMDGNRAELIMDADSRIKRMNLGGLYEQYMNAASRDVSKRVREMLGLDRNLPDTAPDPRQRWDIINRQFADIPQEVIHQVFEYLLGYYQICSPRMVEEALSPEYRGHEAHHLKSICFDGVYLYLPTDNPPEPTEILRNIRKYYPPTYGPVTYEGVTTVNPILIGSMYIMVLEKTGVDWSGVASAKLQHFGIPARVTNMDKYAAPGRGQPVRMLGEAEIRLFNATCGSDVSAELLDQSNNPGTHKAIVNAILKADKPTNIPEVVNREEVPLGNGRNLAYVNHILECAGIRFVRKDDPSKHKSYFQKLAQKVSKKVKTLMGKLAKGR